LKDIVKRGQRSPFYELLSMSIDEVKDRYARLSIKVDRKHTQLHRYVHGGVIASLSDSAAGWAIYGSTKEKRTPVTLEMKTNFIRPVRSGTIVAEARTIHAGSKIVVCDVEVRNPEHGLIAKSLVTYYLVEEGEE
jgi:acyl-CoA thioesterase